MQRDWNSFWAGHGQGSSLTEAPIDAPSLQQGWREYFTSLTVPPGKPCKLADLACGTGEVASLAREVLGRDLHLTCLDYAPAAIETLRKDPQVNEALVGDAAALPFADGAFDIVCSQFGIEYAGEGAFAEAARVTAPGGRARIVAHLQGGAIWSECETNARTISGILESGIFDAADKTFDVMSQIRRGLARPEELGAPLEQVKAAVPGLQRAIGGAPQGSAGRNFAERLYTDFSRIFDRIAAFEPQNILDWSAAMRAETLSYQSRMSSMTSAALDEERLAAALGRMSSAGLDMAPPQTLEDRSAPIAWVIEGSRPA